jgi:hypothetical protein
MGWDGMGWDGTGRDGKFRRWVDVDDVDEDDDDDEEEEEEEEKIWGGPGRSGNNLREENAPFLSLLPYYYYYLLPVLRTPYSPTVPYLTLPYAARSKEETRGICKAKRGGQTDKIQTRDTLQIKV